MNKSNGIGTVIVKVEKFQNFRMARPTFPHPKMKSALKTINGVGMAHAVKQNNEVGLMQRTVL